MKKGDVILVDFSARELSRDELFETTLAEDARAHQVFNPRATYKPVPVVVGKKDFFERLDTLLEEMTVGEEKSLVLEPLEAFGERKAELISVLPLHEFKKNNMTPIPGLVLEADGRRGKVQSVSGGRVRVDFNHPLAGKQVEYKLVIRKKIEKPEEQVGLVLERFFPHVAENERVIQVNGDHVSIQLPSRVQEQKETAVLKEVAKEWLPKQLEWIKKVTFVAENVPTQNTPANAPEKTSEKKPENKPKQLKTKNKAP